MGKKLAIVNQKGGVGKTTTAVNLVACLTEVGKRVLLVDMDPQGNATTGLGVHKGSLRYSIYDSLRDGVPLEEVVWPSGREGLDLVPATIELAGAEVELASALARELRLRRLLEPVAPDYDVVVVDSPPSLGLLTVNCLAAAEGVIVPIQCEYYALEGLGQLRRTLELVRQELNPGLELVGVVLTMYDPRTRLSEDVAGQVRAAFGERVFSTVIPRSVRLSEAPSYGQTILEYAPGSKGARAYRELCREVMAYGTQERAGVADTRSERGEG